MNKQYEHVQINRPRRNERQLQASSIVSKNYSIGLTNYSLHRIDYRSHVNDAIRIADVVLLFAVWPRCQATIFSSFADARLVLKGEPSRRIFRLLERAVDDKFSRTRRPFPSSLKEKAILINLSDHLA